MPGSDDGREEVATQDVMEPLKSLVFTQDQLFYSWKSDWRSRGEGESNTGREDGVKPVGVCQPGGVHVDEAIRVEEFRECSCVNVGPHEFGSINMQFRFFSVSQRISQFGVSASKLLYL